jgi:hypothetical protein
LHHAVQQVVPGADHSLAEEVASDCHAAVVFSEKRKKIYKYKTKNPPKN